MDKKAKIFVAGHRGLVGSAIVRRLEAEDFTNTVLRTSSELDLCNQQAVDRFFLNEQPDYVFLAAARVGGIYANDAYPADFIRDNLQIQTNVIDAAYRNDVTKLLFLGSSCIYPKMADQPMSESALLTGELEPTNEWYAIAKIAGIKMCQAYHRQYRFNAISLMPTNLYGPGDNYDLKTSHVLPALIRKFHLAKLAKALDIEAIEADERRYGCIPDDFLGSIGLSRDSTYPQRLMVDGSDPVQVVLWGTGAPFREFLYVDDLADSCLFLMQNYDRSEVVNIGVGKDVTIKDLAKEVQEIVGFEGEVIWDSSKPNGTPRKLLDITKLSEIGWKSETGFKKGIRLAYSHYCGVIPL